MPRIDDIDDGHSKEERSAFFRAVYDRADGDTSKVPWTNEQAKPEVLGWLATHPARAGARALDVACGLGENAEALADAGYDTLAFDISERAIVWARARFPDSKVDYRVADLFNLPEGWGLFDLVHECYTLQSFPDTLRSQAFGAITEMVAPGGTLLIYARVRSDQTDWPHAPWPVMLSEFTIFEEHGLELISQAHFDAPGGGGMIPHAFLIYKRAMA